MLFSQSYVKAFISAVLLLFAITAQLAASKSYDAVAKTVQDKCGACHYTPSPSLMPKRSWPYVVKSMVEIAEQRLSPGFITEEQMADISAYYYGSAPVELGRLPYFEKNFVPKSQIALLGRQAKIPLVINIKSVDLTAAQGQEFLVCDGESDTVSHVVVNNKQWKERVLAKVSVPSNAVVVDIDQDGDKDVLVAALGLFFPPTGVYAGQVVLLEQTAPGKFEKKILLEGVGRVTDAQPVDMDDDGDLDIALSIFGGDVPGELAWMENLGKGKGYTKRTLISMGGGLNITPVDINQDGKLDLVSYLTQEYEQIVAFINRGNSNYTKAVLFQAGHPMVGPTSISFSDIDKDGDTDILFTNGDAHDYQYDPKPYHGVQWLENKGEFNFVYHELSRFYGASYAQAADMDGDGDKDIVASSWNNYWEDANRQTLIWYENDGAQNFKPHPIIHEPSSIVSFALVESEGSKSKDIIAGLFNVDLLKKYINLRVKDADAAESLLKAEDAKPRLIRVGLSATAKTE